MPDAFYVDIIQTDLLKELDAIHTLPASMYSMLFTIAVYCEDTVSSIRATDLLLTLLSSHSQYPLSFVMCLPPSEELYSVLTDYGSYLLSSLISRILRRWRGYDYIVFRPSRTC